MNRLAGIDLLVALVTASAAALAAGLVWRPTARLGPRVRPYTVAARSSLGRGADVGPVADPGVVLSGSTLRRLFDPIVGRLAARLGALVDRGDEDRLLMRLRQAGLLADVPVARRVQEYRVRQLATAAAWAGGAGGTALITGRGVSLVLAGTTLGFVVGVTRLRGRVDKAIERRRLRMRIELYTVNQLLAMHVRVGGGVVQAVQRVVERGSGPVIEEFAEVLRVHRSGRRVSEALQFAARVTPEPHAARTYRLLASGAELGADLATGLRLLSEDIRGQRTEALKRAATRRRAAMLLPIIAILAPVMLLFIAAPLPSIIFGAP
jgi:tight adherence protein C